MKKFAVMLITMLVILAGLPAFADGITIDSGGGDKVAVFQDADIVKNTQGNVVVVFGDLNVNAEVNGDIIVVLGNLDINSRVNGQVLSVLGKTRLQNNAQVYGNLISLGSLEKSPNAVVSGQELRIYGKQPDFVSGLILISRAAAVIAFMLLVMAVGLIWLAFSKKRIVTVEAHMEYDVGRKLLLGLIGFAGATILAALLFITVIAPVLYLVLVVAGAIVSSIYFGRVILRAFTPHANVFAELTTGLLTITLFKILLIYFIPHEELFWNLAVYLIFTIFINSLGIGIILDAKYGRSRLQKQTAQ